MGDVERRIFLFRILTVISLLSTGILCATFSYLLLSQGEEHFYDHQYHSLTKSLHRSLLDGIESRVSAGQSYAAIFGGYCSHSYSWPNCWIPYITFIDITTSLGLSLHMILTGILTIVRPEEVNSFETFIKDKYILDNFSDLTVCSWRIWNICKEFYHW